MSDLDNQIIDFKESMTMAAVYAKGDANTDVITPAGPIPSIAKQARINTALIAALAPNLDVRLRLDANGGYTDQQMSQGRANLGLDRVVNVDPAELPISIAVQTALQQLITQINTKQVASDKNQPNGFAGLDNSRLVLRNADTSVGSFLSSSATQPRNWVMPDQSGQVALKSDITGNNTGTNTGDETTARVKSLLGITTISGDNTGDETQATILQKLGATKVIGSNTGDETRDRIVNLIGYEPFPAVAVGKPNGAAPLDDNNLIPPSYLPALFESVVMVGSIADLPAQGVAKRIYVTMAESGMYYWNQVTYFDLKASLSNTDQLAEGQDNLYFTQARVLHSILSEFNASASANPVTGADNLIAAFSKLQAQATQLKQTKEDVGNKAINFTVVNDTLYPTTKAVKNYMDTRLSSVVNDQGSWSAASNDWPTSGSLEGGGIKKGDFWYVSAAGKLGGVDVNVGDSFRALVDNPGTTASNWDVLESNLGFVPYNATNPQNFTSNQTDAYLLDRTNHTGTQSADTIVDSATRVMVLPAEKTAITHANRAALDLVSGTNTGDETKVSIEAKLNGALKLAAVAPVLYFDENDQGGGVGLWRVVADGGVLRFDINTAAARDFSTFTSPWVVNANGSVSVPALTGLNVSPPATAGNGSSVVVNAQSSSGTGNGGTVSITAGSGSGASGNGGNVNITAGGSGAGTKGKVVVVAPGGMTLDTNLTISGIGVVGSDAAKGVLVSGQGSSADVTLADRNQATRLSVSTKGINVVGTIESNRGADIVSAATLDLSSATGNTVDVTGSTAITNITLADGAWRMLRFTGSLVLTASANLVLPTGLNITTAAGDYAFFVGRTGGVVHCVYYARASGAPLVGGLLDKSRSITASTASTSIDLNAGDQAVAFKVTVAANTTLTFSNPPAALNGELFSFTVITINDGTAGRGLAFGNTIKWAGGNLPPRTTSANAIDVWTFFVDNGVYYGSLAIADAK